jgi:hypothetical protein
MNRPLGRFETAQAITYEHFPFNAVISVHISNGPSPQILRQVLDLMQDRHPLLGVHIEKKGNRFFYVSDGTPAIPLNVMDSENDEHWRDVVEDELNLFIDFQRGPLLRVNYLSGSEHHYILILTFHHAIMDAESGSNLIHEILICSHTVAANGSTKICKPLKPLPPAESLFPVGFRGIRRFLRNTTYLFRQIFDELRFRFRATGKSRGQLPSSGKCKIHSVILPEELSSRILKRSRSRGVSLNNLFSAAILQASHKHLFGSKEIPLRHFYFSNLRPYLSPPPTTEDMGSYFSMLRFTIDMKPLPDLWTLADAVGNITYPALKRGDKYCSNLLSPFAMQTVLRSKSSRMGSTALSFTGALFLEKHYGDSVIEELHAFVSNFVLGPMFTAQVRWFKNQFYWDFLYIDSDMDHSLAVTIANDINRTLADAIEETCK